MTTDNLHVMQVEVEDAPFSGIRLQCSCGFSVDHPSGYTMPLDWIEAQRAEHIANSAPYNVVDEAVRSGRINAESAAMFRRLLDEPEGEMFVLDVLGSRS